MKTAAPDFSYLLKLPEKEADRIVQSMSEKEFATFSAWCDDRTQRLLHAFDRIHSVRTRKGCYKKRRAPVLSRIDQVRVSPLMLDVLDYLSGLHPLLCSSPEERANLGTTRDLADAYLELMSRRGVRDRHEAAQILEATLAAKKRKKGAR